MPTTFSPRAIVLGRIARGVAAVILLQTLYFKFSGAPESRAIFEQLGMEPWGRLGSGVMELIASLLLLRNRTSGVGGALAMGLMAGAIGSHLFVIGIEQGDDGGLLFVLACVTFLAGAYLSWLHRTELLRLIPRP